MIRSRPVALGRHRAAPLAEVPPPDGAGHNDNDARVERPAEGIAGAGANVKEHVGRLSRTVGRERQTLEKP
jgi:hypothetical protein